MLQTARTEKLDEKMGPFAKFSYFLPELWSINCPKMCIFYNFVLTSARNLSLPKQFTYMNLKVFITFFQKMVCFIGVRAAVHEILAIKISKKRLNRQKFNKILQFQILISPKQ